MTPSEPTPQAWKKILRGAALGVAFALAQSGFSAETAKKAFNLPAEPAEAALKRFSQQAGMEVVFVSAVTDGVRVNPVRGEFTPIEAGERLLAGTGLTLVRDAKTGVLSVTRANGATAQAPKNADSRPASAPAAAAGQANGAAPIDSTIVLSTFRVDASKDVGYRATNSTSGTRLNTPIKDLPMPINVVTKEFIEDIGAYDFKEALIYEAGITQDFIQTGNNFLFSASGTGQAGQGLGDRSSTTINIRGYNSRRQLRSGFVTSSVTDNVNVSRVEVAKGPQSLLYGVAVLGGVVNIIPDYPLSVPRYEAKAVVGSDDFLRFEFDATGPMVRVAGKQVNYRLAGAYQRFDGDPIRDGDDRERRFLSGLFEVKPFEKTNVLLDVEGGIFRTEANGFRDLSDTNNAAENVLNAYGENTPNTVFGDLPQVARDWYGSGEAYRLSGDDPFSETRYYNVMLEITQKLTDQLSLIGGINYSRTDVENLQVNGSVDYQRVFNGGQPLTAAQQTTLANLRAQQTYFEQTGLNFSNPLFSRNYTGANDFRFRRLQYNWTRPSSDNENRQVRIDLNYNFDLLRANHNFLVGFHDRKTWSKNLGSAPLPVDASGVTNSFKSFSRESVLTPIRYAGEGSRTSNRNVFEEWNAGHYVVYQGKYWKDRVLLIGGLRRDRYMVRSRTWNYSLTPGADAREASSYVRNDTPTPATGTTRADFYRFKGETQYKNSPTAGISFKVNDAISVYALTATGFFPDAGQQDGAGNAVNPEFAKSREVGVKFDLLRDREGRTVISGAVAGYNIRREDAVYNVFWAPQPRSNNGTGLANVNVPSSWTSFQTNQPQSYLLPVQYIAAGDLASYRNSPAFRGERNNLVLVDYRSLGTAAADPLRRGMEAAATASMAQGSQTILQNASTGNTPDDLYANLAYENRNANVNYADESSGIDVSFLLTPNRNYSATFSYSYQKQEVIGGFGLVDQPNSTEYDSWWRYMGFTTQQALAANLDESSVDFDAGVKGVRLIDNPEHSANVWNKYTFTEGALKGWDVGLGINWFGSRQAEAAIDNGLRRRVTGRFRADFSERYVFNTAIGHRRKIGGLDWTFRLNVNNVLDDTKDERIVYNGIVGTVTGVPARSLVYYTPRTWQFSVGTKF
jgi:outer membrane receptor protein involved in Fe transport